MPRSGSFSEYWLGVLHWSHHSENTTVSVLSTIHMENAPPGPSIVGLSQNGPPGPSIVGLSDLKLTNQRS